jgi:hypothetical protein
MLNLLTAAGWHIARWGTIVLFMLVFGYVLRMLLLWVSAL